MSDQMESEEYDPNKANQYRRGIKVRIYYKQLEFFAHLESQGKISNEDKDYYADLLDDEEKKVIGLDKGEDKEIDI